MPHSLIDIELEHLYQRYRSARCVSVGVSLTDISHSKTLLISAQELIMHMGNERFSLDCKTLYRRLLCLMAREKDSSNCVLQVHIAGSKINTEEDLDRLCWCFR